MAKKKLTKQQVAHQRAQWREAAARERQRMAEEPSYRIAVLRRPSVRSTMTPALWKAKVAEARAEAQGAARKGKR